MRRVVIFSAGIDYSVRKGIAELMSAFPHVEWLLLEHAPSRQWAKTLRNQWRNVRRHGWRWIWYQATELQRIIRSTSRSISTTGGTSPGQAYEWPAIVAREKLTHWRVPDIHSPDAIARLQSFAPDLGISLAAPILRASLFDVPRLGSINLHKGKLPDYRGMPPAFWELYNGESEVGCTVHRVAEKLDAGPILLQTTVPRSRYSTVRGMQLILDEVGVELTNQAVAALGNGIPNWQPQPRGGKTFRRPSLKQESELRARLDLAEHTPRPRRVLKDSFFRGYVHLARPVPRLLRSISGRQKIVVLLYHRVNDDMRDSLTVGIEQFDQQMALLRSRYSVVSIADIVTDQIPRNTRRPVIAVTFDDGYLDNYRHAVPVLLRHGIPAAFFVSTGVIGGTQGFAHDRMIGPIPTMDWDQVSRMHALGFVIGSHTVNHIDCAKADEQMLAQELAMSADSLRTRLGLREIIFAYPFGGRNNMTSRALEMVKASGYRGCLSAYGGANCGPIDPFNVLRVGIDHRFSMPAFRARLEGFG